MKDRLPFQSWGSEAFVPGGALYAQFPDDLWGLIGKRTQFVLRALLLVWNGKTVTDISRLELRKIINELRAAKGLGEIFSLRSITWHLCELVRLKIIARDRIDHSNIWTTCFTKPFFARLNEPAELPAAEAAKEPEIAQFAISYCKERGWNLVLNEGGVQFRKEAIPDVEQQELSRDFVDVYLRGENARKVLGFLHANHGRE